MLQTRELQQAVKPGTRFALVTATLPEPVWLDLQAIFPDIRMAKCAPLLLCSDQGLLASLCFAMPAALCGAAGSQACIKRW